jgi:hypothetical protein
MSTQTWTWHTTSNGIASSGVAVIPLFGDFENFAFASMSTTTVFKLGLKRVTTMPSCT